MAGRPLREVFMLNDEAASLLESGNCLDAIRTFQRGVSILKDYSSLQNDHHSSAAGEGFYTATSNKSLEATGRQINGLKHGPSFVFSRPLPLNASYHESHESEFAVISSGSILLFNLGLAYHMLSVQNKHTVSMKRASKYYNRALSLLSRVASPSATARQEVLKCLILNNLAQIHYEECDYQGSQYYIQRMHALVRTGCLTSPSASLYISKMDSDEIKLNLVCLRKPTSARAA